MSKKFIRDESLDYGFTVPQTAYVMATVYHETAGTWKPVREAFWLSEAWRKRNLRYYPYYGRGYVQITWKENYQKYEDLLGWPLVAEPDIALVPDVALEILLDGFKYGRFTGRKISRYINDDKIDFRNARRCINGTDKARKIARRAIKYLNQMEGV